MRENAASCFTGLDLTEQVLGKVETSEQQLHYLVDAAFI